MINSKTNNLGFDHHYITINIVYHYIWFAITYQGSIHTIDCIDTLILWGGGGMLESFQSGFLPLQLLTYKTEP